MISIGEMGIFLLIPCGWRNTLGGEAGNGQPFPFVTPDRLGKTDMVKYVFYVLIAVLVAFGVEFFGIYDVPVLELPGYFQDDDYYLQGRERQKEAVREIEEGAK